MATLLVLREPLSVEHPVALLADNFAGRHLGEVFPPVALRVLAGDKLAVALVITLAVALVAIVVAAPTLALALAIAKVSSSSSTLYLPFPLGIVRGVATSRSHWR